MNELVPNGRNRTRSVLHVLPHRGGGGETYVDHLARIEGYRFDKTFVSPGPRPSPAALTGALRAQSEAVRHDVLHVHGEVASGLCLPSLALRPSVVTINGLHLVRRLGGWRRTVAEGNLRLIVRAASATICVSEAELDHVRSVLGDHDKLVLIPNGVDSTPIDESERDSARAELGLSPADVAGVVLAGLDSHKEPLVAARAALDAAQDATSLVLMFAGDGPLRSELLDLADSSPPIRVLGHQSDAHRVLAAADFFVLPSRREGLSFALLEAMSRGLPPVVSDDPANTEAVGDAGVVVPAGDVAGFAAAMRRLASDAAARQELGTRARDRIATRFSADEMARRTGDVYESVLAGHRRPARH